MSTSGDRVKVHRAKLDAQQEIIDQAMSLKQRGYSSKKVANALGIKESTVRLITDTDEIAEENVLWFPGIYHGREGLYAQRVSDLPIDDIKKLVILRAKEDGEWTIANGFVGNNEDNMRRMMAWVSDPKNIEQCVEANQAEDPTIDWICRDLANGSKWIHGSHDD